MPRWTQAGPPPLLTVKEVADILRVHPSKFYRMLESGEFPAFKIGGHWRISRLLLHEWIEEETLRHSRKRG